MFFLHFIHYVGFIGALVFNLLLVLLIVTRSKYLFESYRFVLLIFVVSSTMLSSMEILTQPVLYMRGPIFVIFVEHSQLPMAIRNQLPALHCATFSLFIAVLAAQFFYRYMALCKAHWLKYFVGARIFTMFIPCLMVYIIWLGVVEWGMSATLEKREYVREALRTIYQTDSMSAPFISSLYWTIGADGEKVWRFEDVTSTLIGVFIMVTLSSIIVCFALKIFFHMKTASTHMSTPTLELNRQLFRMLLFQTVAPIVFVYTPVGLFIVMPFFELSMGEYVNLPNVCTTMYPMIEPMIAMYCIADFRKAIKNSLPRIFKKRRVSSITNVSNVMRIKNLSSHF